MKECSIKIPADFRFNASLRALSENIFTDAGFKEREIQRLVLVFDEVFMNGIKYGSDGPEDSLHLSFVWEKEKYVKVTVEDEGKQMENVGAEEVKKKMNTEFLNINPSKSHGRGLAQIAINLTDDLQIVRSSYGGVSVTFQKNIPRS